MHVVKKFYLKPVLLLLLLTATIFSFGQSLTGIPGLALWLKADVGVDTAVGGLVTTWHDQSGGGNDATATAGSQPTLISAPTLNHMPTLKFDGISQFLSGPQIAAFNSNGSSCGTYLFMVSKSDGTQASGSSGLFVIGAQLTGMLWEYNPYSILGELFVSNQTADAANDYVCNPVAMPAGAYPFKIFEVRKVEGNSVSLAANTVVSTSGNPANSALTHAFTNGPYTIATAAGLSNHFNGEIAELIAFTGTCLTPSQILQVETYLGYKYSPPLSAGNDTVIPHSLCPITLTATAGYSSYLWSTGATTQTATATKTGSYSVAAVDAFGITHYDTVQVTFPAISLNTSVTLCQGSSVELVPNLPGFANYTFHWSNGATTDSISVNTGGRDSVTVTDAIGHCTVTTNSELVVVDAFRSTVTLTAPPLHCAGNRLSLTTPTTGWSHLLFNWSNGSTDSLTEVSTTGVYAVTVTDTIGCSASASVNITVAGVAPHVNFTVNQVCVGTPFSPGNISDSVGVTYAWAFGDGASSTQRFPTHTFLTPGIFPVHLTVSNAGSGCSNDTIIPVTVNKSPTAQFQSGVVCTSGPVFTFNDLSVPVAGQTITNWSWNFGDPAGGTSSMQDPTYQFAAVADTYQVTLAVTQSNGCVGNTSNIFVVINPTIAPTAPVLEFPANGSMSASTLVTFGWQTATGAVYYKHVVSPDPTFATQTITTYNIYTNQLTLQLQPNTVYYWQVTAFNPCGDIAYSAIDTVTTFSPANLSSLALWLKADSGVSLSSGSVTQWNDESGNNYNATASGSAAPTVNSVVPLLNHLPAVKFNGTTNNMVGPTISGLDQSSVSVFIVAKADGGQPANADAVAGIFTIADFDCGLWIERGGGGFGAFNAVDCGTPGNFNNGNIFGDANSMPPGVASPFHIYGFMKNYNVAAYIDTNTFIAGSIGTKPNTIGGFANGNYNLGHMIGTDPYNNNSSYGYLNGEIAEVIVYKTYLNYQQKAQVEQYLFSKYAPPVNLGPDIVQTYSLCPITLKTGSRFISYLWSTGQTSDTIIVHQGGKYWVRTVDVFNRTSSDTINITLPYQGSNPDTDYVCHGDTGQILQLISNPSLYHYQWFDSTSPSSVVNLNVNADLIRPATAGYYYTKIIDTSGCSFITKKVPVIIDNFYAAQLLPAKDTICRLGTLTINIVPYTIDSFLWQPIADTTSAPVIAGSGTYYLYTVDHHGCKNLDSTQVTTRAQAPVVNFTVPNTCLANTTSFIDSSFAAPADSITSYFWNYGGGLPSTDTTVNGKTSYEINYGYGNYTVSLKVTTDSGCFGIKTRHITIQPSPHAGFSDSANNSVYPYILCAGSGSSLQLTDTSSAIGGSAISQRFWRINGAVNANHTPNVQYSFPNQGDYNIQLEVVNSLGCADSTTQTIAVHAPFVAAFTYTDHCLGDYTTFTDVTNSFSIVSRTWKFRENGDGPYAYTPVANFRFNQANTYDVELQVENSIGCIARLDQEVKIVQKPTANFTGLIGCENHYYQPLDSSIVLNDTILNWAWNIGNIQYNVKNPSILFTDTGALNVKLTITTQEGCVDSVQKVLEVGPVPTALFSFTPLYGTAPLAVTFNNRSTGATNYFWNFGDGNSTTTAIPAINPAPHTYTQNGNYRVVLYAYNNYGCYDSLARTLNIIPTDLDLAIDYITTKAVPQADGSQLVTLIAYISNLGTRVITSAQLYATLGSRGVMEQNWSGFLASGQTIVDTFPAQFVVPEGYGNTYVCVTASDVNGGETELNYNNNQECVSLTGSMQLAGPLPNPAISASQLGIIMPSAGTVYISIYDLLGHPVIKEFSMNLPTGRTNYAIPIAALMSAEYFIRVRYNDDTEVRNFVVR